MITNELIKENNYLLKTIFDNKPNLDLLLTSGNKPCYDLTYVEEYITEELPSCIFDFNYNNIYCDSRYISPEMAQSIKDNYNKEVIIKIFNNISYDKYKQFTCINYIENIKDYNTDIKNIYILNDDNILNDYSDNIELVDFKITKLTPELQKLFLKQEIKQFTKLKDN